MSTRRVADIIFCIDSSSSMRPCFNAVKDNLGSLLQGLQDGQQCDWDLRFDFLAYCATEDSQHGVLYGLRSLRARGTELMKALYGQQSSLQVFFTKDAKEFRDGLSQLTAGGDEASLVALDTALDFPWREIGVSHRIIVLLTDEPLETGLEVQYQKAAIPRLIQKIHDLRVALHLVAPQSGSFDQISAADKSEYTVVDDSRKGLINLNFPAVLEGIGKSISSSTLESAKTSAAVPRGIFGQSQWVASKAVFKGE